MRIQSRAAIFLFPGGQESSIYSTHVPRINIDQETGGPIDFIVSHSPNP